MFSLGLRAGLVAVSLCPVGGTTGLRQTAMVPAVFDVQQPRLATDHANASIDLGRPWWAFFSDALRGSARRRRSLVASLSPHDDTDNLSVEVANLVPGEDEHWASIDDFQQLPVPTNDTTNMTVDSSIIMDDGDEFDSNIEKAVEIDSTGAVKSVTGGEVPEGPVQTKNLLFGAHHKTGTVLAGDAVRCFDRVRTKIDRLRKHAYRYPDASHGVNASYADVLASQVPNVTTDVHWQGPVPQDFYVVHFVRNTASVAVSAYEYHKNVGENWTRVAGSALEVLESAGWFTRHAETNESYTDFLNRVPVRVGMHAELFRLQREFNHMINASAWCTLSPETCHEVCLESFTSSSDGYKQTWSTIMDFIGISSAEVRDPLLNCLERFDLHNETIAVNNHVTNGTMSKDQHQKIMELEAEMDRKYFGSTVGRLAAGTYRCAAEGTGSFDRLQRLVRGLPQLTSSSATSFTSSSRRQRLAEEKFA